MRSSRLTRVAGAGLVAAVLLLTPGVGLASPLLYFVHTDHLNTPRLIADQNGTTVWRWEQVEPFGANAPDEDPDGDSVIFHMPFRFPGQYFDKETNLHYSYQRDGYDSNIGRFTQPEPVGLIGDINLYRYARDNPLAYIDPDGLTPTTAIGTVVFPGPGTVVGAAIGTAIAVGIGWYAIQSSSSSSGNETGAGGKSGTQALPTSGRCSPEDWEYCYRKCGGRPNTEGCYVSYRWKTRMMNLHTGGSIREAERIVNCNCACP